MANAFSITDAQQGEPIEIVAGDLTIWRRDDLISDYPTADYSMSYTFQCAEFPGGSHHEFDVTGNEDSTGYYFQILGATTLALNHLGDFKWQLYVTRTSDSAQISLATGTTKIIPNFDDSNIDPRSHAEIMLTKIESLLEGKADSDVSSYSIAGRSLTKLTPEELITWRNFYKAEVLRERQREDIKLGRKSPTTVKVRFT